ncbi:MAG: SsrA-binding protein SmpB [Myxococcales bacterium]|nr:SsrA-binding protein SmpB [Myxococcales bacterium]MCB9671631.1 SsrA-binding protein SmpB [Alphaproteobacteria bacterium]MCB9693130.1 SsrA-binding protein SmpB [Alphaproteobacteria bacterium]
MANDEPRIKLLHENRKARHDYTLSDAIEAGLVLVGSEVKSLRVSGNINLTDAYVDIRPDGAWLLGSYIAPYEEANRENHDPRRPRKLLLHSNQIEKLAKATRERGVTLIPIKLYFKGNRVKIEIAVARGKKQYDKREALKARDVEKQLRRIR